MGIEKKTRIVKKGAEIIESIIRCYKIKKITKRTANNSNNNVNKKVEQFSFVRSDAKEISKKVEHTNEKIFLCSDKYLPKFSKSKVDF